MTAALVTTLFFAVTPVFANRAAGLLGSTRANLWRLVVALVLLGAWAHLAGGGLTGPAFGWFVLGGVVGFGVGGVAIFEALPRLGSNLSNLIVQCLSAVCAAAVEWAWLGTRLSAAQRVFAALTLAGVVIGLLPRSLPRFSPAQWSAGLAWALVSAVGQGVGVVISRKAFAVSAGAHFPIDAGTAAYQRVVGGLLVALVAVAMAGRREERRDGRAASGWVLANALTGPVLGVTCYQAALKTTAAGIVQPIVAAAPLLTVPFAFWLEGHRPRGAYYAGALLAVAGVTGLLLAR